MIKIISIVGARPQFIKASTVSRAILKKEGVSEIIIHTGQHYDSNMSDIFFSEMKIPEPKYNLSISNGTHGRNTGRMMEMIEKTLIEERPAGIIVYGDTNTTLAGALAAKKLHIPVFHVEAGLRSFDMRMPEEINRVLTDRISDILFCPTEVSKTNLIDESFQNFNCKIEIVGDVMFDAARFYEGFARIPDSKDHLLVTIHREGNVVDREVLSSIVKGLNTLANFKKIIFPAHPRTAAAMRKFRLQPNFPIIDPVGFYEMIGLIKTADIVITDSGGLQKEAFFYGKNSVVLRKNTEWVELLDNGFTRLVSSDPELLVETVRNRTWANTNFGVPLFGDGTAADKVVDSIKTFFDGQ